MAATMRGMRGLPWILICSLTFGALAGCTSTDEGEAVVFVKDAPADEWQAVHITFTEVSIHQSGGNGTGADGSGTDESGWRVIFSDPAGVTVDLLNTTGARSAFLGAEGLAAGHYQQIRIKASQAHGVRIDGTGVDIAMPDKGYVHTSKSFKVDAGKETHIIIDIDLEKSLVEKGGSWEFKSKIGKVYTQVKEKADKPAKGAVGAVELKDSA